MSLFVQIKKDFKDFKLEVDLSAGEETMALLGASGCGKSMTLKCIAGIVKPDNGKIVINGETVFDSEQKINLPPQQRKVGFLFQNYALFPTMTVWQNIYSVISQGKSEKKTKTEKREIVKEILGKFHLEETKDLYPRQLSGGQQQRVALARILVTEPKIILLDEPFSALDTHLRGNMEREVMAILEEFSGTTILVSHDRDEAYRLSKQIAVMNWGKVELVGGKEAIFANPKTVAAATITGCRNISLAEKVDAYTIYSKDWGISFKVSEKIKGEPTFVGVRANHFSMEPVKDKMVDTTNCFLAKVLRVVDEPFGKTAYCQFIGKGEESVTVKLKKEVAMTAHEEVYLRVEKENVLVLD